MVGMGGKSDPSSHTTLDELLVDPLIQLVMKADKVDAAQIQSLCRNVRPLPVTSPVKGSPRQGGMVIHPTEAAEYRSGAGIMLLNARNEVFVGRRVRGPEDAWQMPQGGIDEGEEPRAAALRELREEIGTDNVEVLAESRGWLRYDLPPDVVGKAWGGRWRGQQQKWFAMRFLGTDAEIDIATEHPEFSAWRWVPASRLPELIVSFKQQLYLEVLQQFQGIQAADAR
jgi:8-oxo-dGTP pyrophosphatase MutT (NUDIX family)